MPEYPYFDQTQNTFLDWVRWSLYSGAAARDRLSSDATSTGTKWESVLA